MIKTGNLRSGLPARPLPDEVVDLLVERPGLRIERIVSTGQATPEGQWYDQDSDELVLVVDGAARLSIEGESEPTANLAKATGSCSRPIAGIA